jgi:hypothetical protein
MVVTVKYILLNYNNENNDEVEIATNFNSGLAVEAFLGRFCSGCLPSFEYLHSPCYILCTCIFEKIMML